jgi:ABC-type lipoprotein release transport system permease subunit
VWRLVANDLRVDWTAEIPGLAVVAIVVVAVIVTLLIALLPARNAGRVRAAAVLRSG